MSAGSLPKLQKTEPWELVQAFADAMDKHTIAQAELRNRKDIQQMKESGENQRQERGSQLALERLAKELSLKEPYEQRRDERSHGYDLDKMTKQGEITRQNYGAYGDESMRQHRSNRTFDFEQDLEYAPKLRESKKEDLKVKEETDALAQRRKNEIDREDAMKRDEYIREKRPEDLQYEGERERQRQGIGTDEAVKRSERMTPLMIEREEKRQEAIGKRRESEAQVKANAVIERDKSRAEVARSLQELKGNQAMQRATARHFGKRGMVRFPSGLIGVNPKDMLDLKMSSGVDFADPSQFRLEGMEQNPVDPGKGPMFFYRSMQPLDPALLQQMTPQFESQGGGGPVAPPTQGGGGAYEDVPLPPQRPPETVAPAIPPPSPTEGTGKGNPLEQLKRGLQGGSSDVPAFGVEDLKRGSQSSNDSYGSPLEQLRNMVATADPALRLQYASFRQPSETIGEVRPQLPTSDVPAQSDRIPITKGRTTTVEKGVQADANTPRGPAVPDIAAPVTTGTPEPEPEKPDTDTSSISYNPRTTTDEGTPRQVNPDRAGYWRKTADQAPSELRDVFDRTGKKYNINPDLLASQTHQESRWNKDAVSPVGARGISQFMPETAKQYGVNARDVESSVDGQARLMKDNLKKYNGNLGLALAAYNQGAGGPKTGRGVWRWLERGGGNAARAPRETRNYVQAITGRPLQWWADKYKAGGTQAPGTMVAQNAPTPPRRPDDLPANTTRVAKNEEEPARDWTDPPPRAGADMPVTALEARRPTTPIVERNRPSDVPAAPVTGTNLRGLALDPGQSRQDTKGFVFHHTGDKDPQGRPIKTVQDVKRVLQDRNLGIQYIMDRDGTIHQMTPDESQVGHIKPGQGIGKGLSNENTIGMEMLAADDKDITPAQIQSARNFYKRMEALYPHISAYSHGEINPHKQATEGSTVVKQLREDWRKEHKKMPKRIKKTENPDLFYVDV